MAKKQDSEQFTVHLSLETSELLEDAWPLMNYRNRSDFFEAAARMMLAIELNKDRGMFLRVKKAVKQHIAGLQQI